MRTLLLGVALLASLYGPQQVSSFSMGAPIDACDTLSPNPTRHGAQPQTTEVPYIIDLSPFDDNGTLEYSPGQTYTCKLELGNTAIFIVMMLYYLSPTFCIIAKAIIANIATIVVWLHCFQ